MVAKSMDAGSTVWQQVVRRDREAGFIQVHPAAPLACVSDWK